MEERYSSSDSFQDSRIHHPFILTANGFEMRIVSADKCASNVSISKIQAHSNITDFIPGIYVAFIYDDDWFVGKGPFLGYKYINVIYIIYNIYIHIYIYIYINKL